MEGYYDDMVDELDDELDDFDGKAVDELGDEPRHFTVHGKKYYVKITRSRLNLYEQRHKPVMASFIQNDGAFSANELTHLLAYGLCKENGSFVKPSRASEMAEKLIGANGYLAVYQAVIEALQRDCGFLFQGA